MVYAEILRCSACRSLAIGLCGKAACKRGCGARKFELVSLAPIPDEAIREAAATMIAEEVSKALAKRNEPPYQGEGAAWKEASREEKADDKD